MGSLADLILIIAAAVLTAIEFAALLLWTSTELAAEQAVTPASETPPEPPPSR